MVLPKYDQTVGIRKAMKLAILGTGLQVRVIEMQRSSLDQLELATGPFATTKYAILITELGSLCVPYVQERVLELPPPPPSPAILEPDQNGQSSMEDVIQVPAIPKITYPANYMSKTNPEPDVQAGETVLDAQLAEPVLDAQTTGPGSDAQGTVGGICAIGSLMANQWRIRVSQSWRALFGQAANGPAQPPMQH